MKSQMMEKSLEMIMPRNCKEMKNQQEDIDKERHKVQKLKKVKSEKIPKQISGENAEMKENMKMMTEKSKDMKEVEDSKDTDAGRNKER